MPNEQGLFWEWAACSTSKTAKDKGNSKQSGSGDMSNRMLRCDSEKDSEKDSGYSEAGSDSVHTDLEDQRSNVSEPKRESSKRLNKINNNVNAEGHNMSPYEELTSIYVIKNLVVKPSRPEQLLHAPLAWGGGWHSFTNAKVPTQLLLIQQQAISAPSTSTPTPSFNLAAPKGQVKKGGSRSNQNCSSKNHSNKNLYLPILNSYPRIAPHPIKEGHDGKSASWVEEVKKSGSEGQSQSKRVCIEEEKREVVSTTSHLLTPQQQQQLQKEGRVHFQSQYKSRGGHSSFPSLSYCLLPSHTASNNQHNFHHCQQSSAADSVGSLFSSQKPSSPSSSNYPSSSSPPSSSPSSSTAYSPYCLAVDSRFTHHRRFFNTAGILNQSGLLAIALRTKELLKQNIATEREIAQLHHHTQLLCQVAQASQNRCNRGSYSINKLLQTMTESGSYPNLDLNELKLFSSSSIQQSKNRSEEDKAKANQIRTSETHSNPPQVYSLQNIDDATSPPSPLFAPSPETEEREHADGSPEPMSPSLSVSCSRSVPEQGHRQAVMDKNLSELTTMPESSTCSNYLL